MPSPDRPSVLHVGKFYPPARGGMEKVLQVLCEKSLLRSEPAGAAGERRYSLYASVREYAAARPLF